MVYNHENEIGALLGKEEIIKIFDDFSKFVEVDVHVDLYFDELVKESEMEKMVRGINNRLQTEKQQGMINFIDMEEWENEGRQGKK